MHIIYLYNIATDEVRGQRQFSQNCTLIWLGAIPLRQVSLVTIATSKDFS